MRLPRFPVGPRLLYGCDYGCDYGSLIQHQWKRIVPPDRWPAPPCCKVTCVGKLGKDRWMLTKLAWKSHFSVEELQQPEIIIQVTVADGCLKASSLF